MMKMAKRFSKLSIIALFCFLTLSVVAEAQIIGQFNLSNELNVELSPEYPGPNQEVRASLTMYTEDLDAATISWYQDGKLLLSGKGETRGSFTTKAAGEETTIEIRITLLNGTSFSKSLTLAPASVDLIWEADSYVPPFYKGKALHPQQGTLKIVAMPEFVRNGVRVSPQNLVYKWSNTVESYQSQSGYGKNVLVLKGSRLGRSESIRVEVSDPNSNLLARSTITIAPVQPEVIFYEKSPYYGHLFDTALNGTFSLKAEEVQVLAVPYFFSNEESGFLQYKWRLNSQSAPALTGSRAAVFKKPEEESGRSSISLSVESANHILQQASQSLMVNFSN